MKTLIILISILVVSVIGANAQVVPFNPYRDPSVYFGGNKYRPYTTDFEEDLLNNWDYDATYNDLYNSNPNVTDNPGGPCYSNRGLPRVFWVAPSLY